MWCCCAKRAQNWGGGEGWPEWSGGMGALYATELTANHMFEEIEHSKKLDEHGASPPCWVAWEYV